MLNTNAPAKPVKRPALQFKTGADAKAMRLKLGLNQGEFWSRVDVTQSGGSRYESGRDLSRPVMLLWHLVYGTEKQALAMLGSLRRN